MNAVALLDLALAVAPMMPSEAATPKASLEWRMAREAWLSALRELGMEEAHARELSGRRIALTDPRSMLS